MKFIPAIEAKSIDDVSPGSLVQLPGRNDALIISDNQRLFSLKERRSVTFNGLVIDFGTDYTLAPEIRTGIRFAYPWEYEHDISGYLIYFPDVGPHIVLGGTVTTLHVFGLVAGKSYERTSNDSEGVAFGEWRLGIPNAASKDESGQDWIYSFPSV